MSIAGTPTSIAALTNDLEKSPEDTASVIVFDRNKVRSSGELMATANGNGDRSMFVYFGFDLTCDTALSPS